MRGGKKWGYFSIQIALSLVKWYEILVHNFHYRTTLSMILTILTT